jgi:hypothetical protein
VEKKDTARAGLWDRLFGIDLRSLALLRIAMGIYLLWDLVDRGRFLQAHYTDAGVFPRSACIEVWSAGEVWERLWAFASFHMISGDLSWQVFLFLVTALCALCLTVGYRARFFAFLCWLMTISIQNRNPHVLHGGDQMVRHTLFWMTFLPLGARFSVDGLCALCKAYHQPVPTRTVSVASAGILIQTALLYWFTSALKYAPEWRGEGTAIYYALSIEHYQTGVGRWLLGLPLILTKLMTWGAIGLEMLGGIVAFFPVATERVRLGLVAVFLIFHLVLIGGLMDVGPISESSSMLWLPFLPALFWDRCSALWQRLPSRGFRALLERVYLVLVRWRNRQIVKRTEKREPLPELRPTKITQLVASLAIVFAVLWNLRGVDMKRYGGYTEGVTWVAKLVRLDQQWAMFAPYPYKDDGWFILAVEQGDGSEIDLLRGGKPVSWAKPASVLAMYTNERDRKYLMNLYLQSYSSQRPYFVHYMLQEWTKAHPPTTPAQEIRRVSLYYMLHMTPPPGKTPPEPKKVLLFSESYTKV